LAASGASDQDVRGDYRYNDTIGGCSGRRYCRFIPFNFLLSLAAPHLHGVLVLVTDNKFIAGVVVTGDNFFAGVVDTAKKLIAGVVYTYDNTFIREYLREFSKNSKRPQ
jgi:hypothetical protein